VVSFDVPGVVSTLEQLTLSYFTALAYFDWTLPRRFLSFLKNTIAIQRFAVQVIYFISCSDRLFMSALRGALFQGHDGILECASFHLKS
jgi:hypothetical protein